jgi:hypothetical protein
MIKLNSLAVGSCRILERFLPAALEPAVSWPGCIFGCQPDHYAAIATVYMLSLAVKFRSKQKIILEQSFKKINQISIIRNVEQFKPIFAFQTAGPDFPKSSINAKLLSRQNAFQCQLHMRSLLQSHNKTDKKLPRIHYY